MPEWLSAWIPDGWTDWHIAIFAVAVGVGSAVVSLLVVGRILSRLPADFFVNYGARGSTIRHPILRGLWVVLRNAIGYSLIALGVVLSLPGVPGQGILTILMGVMLVDFPGKYAVERWLISRRIVLGSVNKLRAKLGREPLILIAIAKPQTADGLNLRSPSPP